MIQYGRSYCALFIFVFAFIFIAYNALITTRYLEATMKVFIYRATDRLLTSMGEE